MPSPGTSHKDRDPVGRPIEPCGYIKVPSPPSDWSVVIDGHKITPRVIQRTLRRCRDAGVDMWYVAERLHIGSGAIVMYMQRERSIPVTVAKRFCEFFTSGESLPKGKSKKTIEWEAYEKPTRPIPRRPPRLAPDYDGIALGAAIAQKRREAQMSLSALGRRVKCSPSYIKSVERGRINYKSVRSTVFFRLCKVLDFDLDPYELKPRVDFVLFCKIAREQMKKNGISAMELSRISGITDTWISRHLSVTKPTASPVNYLEDNIRKIVDALGLNLNEILLTKKEMGNERTGH